MDDAMDSLTNEWIVERLGRYRQQAPDGLWCFDHGTDGGWVKNQDDQWRCWKCSYLHYGYKTDVVAALRDLAPEIVRRGYSVNVLFWGHGTEVHLTQRTRLVERWECTDPPSIALAICEALVRTEGQP